GIRRAAGGLRAHPAGMGTGPPRTFRRRALVAAYRRAAPGRLPGSAFGLNGPAHRGGQKRRCPPYVMPTAIGRDEPPPRRVDIVVHCPPYGVHIAADRN